MLKHPRLLLLLASLWLGCAEAEIKVIAHASNTASVSSEDVSKIFLGKTANFPSTGKPVEPIDLEEGHPLREQFHRKVSGKDPSQLNAYWSRLIFTGKGKPPKTAADMEEMLELVKKESQRIGYVDGSADTSGVKVLLSIP